MGVPSTLVQVVGAAGKGRKGVNIAGDEVIKPEIAGAKKNAKMWSGIAWWTCAVPAIILTAVSALFLVDMASDLGAGWWQVAKLSAVALAVAMTSSGLLALAGMFEDTRPDEARKVVAAWKWSLGAGAAAAVFFVATTGGQPPASTASPRAQDLRAELATLASPAEWDAWNASQGCSTPSAGWRDACAVIKARRAEQWAEVQAIEAGSGDYSPKVIIGTGALASSLAGWFGQYWSEVVRRLVAGGLGFVSMALAGFLARWGALAFQDAQRQADGASVPVPVASASPMSRGGPALNTPTATADLWFAGRVVEDAEGTLNPSAAYEDYCLACQENAQPAMPIGQFYIWLTGKSKAANVTKGKSAGNIVYRGWVLGEQSAGLLEDEAAAALPYHA